MAVSYRSTVPSPERPSATQRPNMQPKKDLGYDSGKGNRRFFLLTTADGRTNVETRLLGPYYDKDPSAAGTAF